MKVLVTGGAGFIGSCFIRLLLEQRPQWSILNIDKLTYAGNVDNLSDYQHFSQYSFVQADISDARKIFDIFENTPCDAIVNFAAESHVDRSIADASAFIQSNIVGTQVLLDIAKRFKIKRFVQVSTDEVYGSLGETGFFTEDMPLAPNSPYSASKASADLLVRAYVKTYGLPMMITRCSNNYGPYQYPEKMIPLFILRALQNEPLPMYGDGLYVRDWIHVEEHAEAILMVLESGKPGEIYNIGAHCEKRNIDIAYRILDILGKPKTLIQTVTDRLGHDHRYAIDASKIISELKWQPKRHLDQELPSLIQWYQEHASWWKKINEKKY